MHKRSSSLATVLLALLAILANHSTQAAAARASRNPLQSLWTQTRSLLQKGDDADSPTKAPAKGSGSEASSVTVVKSPRALRDAVKRGDAHIEIQGHLDLTSLKPMAKGLLLGVVPETVRSIRGNCEGDAPSKGSLGLSGVDLLPLKAGQCVLKADNNLLASGLASLWLQSLYVRLHRNTGGTFNSFLGNDGVGKMWMTDVTLQGDGDGVRDCDSCGLSNWARVYAEGCTFAHFDGYNTVRVGGGGTGSFVNCTFTGNQITTTFTDNSVIEADAGQGSDTLISLEQCAFSDNLPSPPRLIAADHSGRDWKGLIYSDQGEEVTVISDSSQKWQGPAAPLSEVPINKGLMLTAEDDELKAIQEEADSLPREELKAGNKLPTHIIFILSLVGAILLCGGLGCIGYTNWSKRKGGSHSNEKIDVNDDHSTPTITPPPPGGKGAGPGIPPHIPTTTMPAPYDPNPKPPAPTLSEMGLQATNPNNLIPQPPAFDPSSTDSQLHKLDLHDPVQKNAGQLKADALKGVYAYPQSYQSPHPLKAPPEGIANANVTRPAAAGGPHVFNTNSANAGANITSNNLSSEVPGGYSSSPEIKIQSMSDVPSPQGSLTPSALPEPSAHPLTVPVTSGSEVPRVSHASRPSIGTRFSSVMSDAQGSLNGPVQVDSDMFFTPEGLPSHHGKRDSQQMSDLMPTPTEIMMATTAGHARRGSGSTLSGSIAHSAAAAAYVQQARGMPSQQLTGSATLNLPSPLTTSSAGSARHPGHAQTMAPSSAPGFHASAPSAAGIGPMKTLSSDGTAPTTASSSVNTAPHPQVPISAEPIDLTAQALLPTILPAVSAPHAVGEAAVATAEPGALNSTKTTTATAAAAAAAAAPAPPTPTYTPPSPPVDSPRSPPGVSSSSYPEFVNMRQASTPSKGPGLPQVQSDMFDAPALSGTLAVQVAPIAVQQSNSSFQKTPANTGEVNSGMGSGGVASGMGSPYSVNFGTYYPSVVPPPGSEAPMQEKISFLNYQLDSIRRDSEVAEGLVLTCLPGGQERVIGSQSVMQMAKSKVGDEEWSLKFFLSKQEFDKEAAMHRDRSTGTPNPLTQFLPKMCAVYENTDKPLLVDPSGHALPPCIVTEREESLDLWVEWRRPTYPEVLAAVREIGNVVLTLHTLSYIHTDLRPSSVAYLPRVGRWTLTSLGNAARKGADTPLATRVSAAGVAYAAPEVVMALQTGAQAVPASPAHDAWALGVLVFEAATGQSVMQLVGGRDETMAAILGTGAKRLPWEDPQVFAGLSRQLGAVQGPMLQLLHRDPSYRIPVAEFCRLISAV